MTKKLTIITFLIALFFLVKYIISVIPRYETKEEIRECKSYEFYDDTNVFYCGDEEFSISYYKSDSVRYENIKDYYCTPATTSECYIKYKQRIK